MADEKKKPEDEGLPKMQSVKPGLARMDTGKKATGMIVAPETQKPLQDPTQDVGAPQITPEQQQTASPDVGALTPEPATPHLAGSSVPAGQEAHGKEYYNAALRDFGDKRRALSSAQMIALDPNDPDYMNKLAAHQAQHAMLLSDEGRLKREEAEFKEQHPWGSMDSAHPGIGGKIGHAFGVLGNVVGNATLGAENMAQIPSSQAHLSAQSKSGQAEEAKGVEQAGKAATTASAEAEVPLKQAQTKEALTNAEHGKLGTTPEATTLHDLMTGGPNGTPRTNPDTGRPYQYLDAYTKLQGIGQEVKDQPLGNHVAPLNQALSRRWQVLNPGQALPSEYTLPNNATAKDFDRIDKVLGQNESAVGTKAQRDLANEARQQTLALAQQAAQDRQEKAGMKWAVWNDPKTGKTVAGPVSLAEQVGAKNAAELGMTEIKDLMNARHAVTLLSKKGDPSKPETQGALQLIEELDKDGKLGVLSSRFNRWMTTGVGSEPGDDPRIITLIDKNMLGQTATMLAHFGASGGRSPQMLQHFLDLSNAGKMDGDTLKAGTKAVLDYMQDRAMLPEGENAGGGQTPNAPAAGGSIDDLMKDFKAQRGKP